MDALTRISVYFPTATLTIFQLVANLIINDNGYCSTQERQLLITMEVLFAIICFATAFTDSYTATNGMKYWVFLLPGAGPQCFSLPTEYDKDRVYEFYYLKIRDYVHALVSTLAFLLISMFTNPVCMCLYPSGLDNGTARFDASIVRTVPLVVAVTSAVLMICLGPPRQMLGYQNVPETCPPFPTVEENPIFDEEEGMYDDGYGGDPRDDDIIEEADEEGEDVDPREMGSRGGGGGDYYGGSRGGGGGFKSPASGRGREREDVSYSRGRDRGDP